MKTSMAEIVPSNAINVTVTDEALTVALSDGRTISVPLAWYPRLLDASPKERSNWRLIGRGQGIHWNDLDEDISVENLLAGRHSGESQTSLKRWLEGTEEGAAGMIDSNICMVIQSASALPAPDETEPGRNGA